MFSKRKFDTKGGSFAIKVSSIEAQLKILKGLNKPKLQSLQQKELKGLKGILKGEGKFSEEDLEGAKIRFKERL